jgi:hypothetical protein
MSTKSVDFFFQSDAMTVALVSSFHHRVKNPLFFCFGKHGEKAKTRLKTVSREIGVDPP